MMKDVVKFQIGQTVYHKLNSEHPGIVTGILFRPSSVIYIITWGCDKNEKYHYDVEITEEKSFVNNAS